jgi:signal transduction histidine kinase
MKKIILLLTGVAFFMKVLPQNAMIDSIRVLEKQTTGKEKAKHQADLSWLLARYDLDSSKVYGLRAVEFHSQEGGNDTLLSDAFNVLGMAHARNGQPDEAVSYYLKSLEINERLAYSRATRTVLNHLAILYKNLEKYELAQKYAQRSLQMSQEAGNQEDIGIALNTLGTIYYRMKENEKALNIHLEALEIREKIGNDRWTASSLGSVGNALGRLERDEEALGYYKRALEKFRLINNLYEEGNTLANIGSSFLNLEKPDSAIHYLLQAEKMGNLHSDLHLKEVIDVQLMSYYEQIKDYKKALEYANKSRSLHDSLVNLETTNRISELEVKYQTEQKEKQIAIQALALERKESELVARQRLIMILIISSIALLFFFLFFIQRSKRKAQAEKDAALIRERDKGTRAVLIAQEEERKRISRDLHDGVGQQLSGLKMAFQDLSLKLESEGSERSEEMKKLSAILSESADEVRFISHQMMPKALTELGLVEALTDMLEKSLGTNNIPYEFNHFGLEERPEEQVEITLYRVAQELINNILKHSGANEVNIQLLRRRKFIVLIVEDNGKGLNSVESDGHGLWNIKSRLNTLKGEVNFEQGPHQGLLATIRIPIA